MKQDTFREFINVCKQAAEAAAAALADDDDYDDSPLDRVAALYFSAAEDRSVSRRQFLSAAAALNVPAAIAERDATLFRK